MLFNIMKSLKFIILCSTVNLLFMMLSSVSHAAIRVGISEMFFQDQTNLGFHNFFGGEKQYIKSRIKYQKIMADLLSQTGLFEPVLISIEENTNASLEAAGYAPLENSKPYYKKSVRNNNAGTPAMIHDIYSILGRQKNCRYILNGDIIIMVNKDTKAKEIHVGCFLFDVRNNSGTHFSSEQILKEGSASKTSKKTKSPAKQKSQSKAVAKPESIEQISKKLLLNITTQISDRFTGNRIKITAIDGNKIILDRGTSSGINVGDTYKVYTEVSDGMEEIFGSDKNSTRTVDLAFLKIVEVQENSSTAEIVENGGNISTIRIDDNIVPVAGVIMEAQLQAISKGKLPPFPSQHPEIKKVEIAASKSTSEAKTALNEPLPALPPGVIRIGIVKFDNQANGFFEVDASTLTDLFSRILSNSDKIAVLERDRLEAIANEHKLNFSGIIDPAAAAKIGNLASCQYILLGSITGIEEKDTISGRYIRPTEKADFSKFLGRNTSSKGAGILLGLAILSDIVEASNVKKDNFVIETHEVITNVNARLINVQTSQVAATFTGQGSAAQSDVVTQDENGNIKGVDSSYGDIENQSIASAAANLGNMIREFLTGEKIQVSSVNNGEIIINRGSSSGVQTGDLFCVYSEGQSDGDTEAIIQIKEVQDSFSTAELVKSIDDSYSVTSGSRLEFVLHSDFQKGIWHIKNQKRTQTADKANKSILFEDLANSSGKKKRFENSSTDAKKVIKSYGLTASKEKLLLNAHSKAAKANSSKKKYEAYKQLSEADNNDYLAAYNTGRYALEQSMYIEAREWASKALFINPNYAPAKKLIEKIDNGD